MFGIRSWSGSAFWQAWLKPVNLACENNNGFILMETIPEFNTFPELSNQIILP
jgi:hypothetical protein